MRQDTFKIFILIIVLQSCASKTKIVTINNVNVAKSEKIDVAEIPIDPAMDHEKTWGLDISHYQEVYDWSKLKEHEVGFIFVKATEGTTLQDAKYAEYYYKIRELKIPVGSYHFFTYMTSGKTQAQNFLSYAKFQRGDLPLVLDAEFAKKMPKRESVIKELNDFVMAIYNKTKTYPIIYCPQSYYLQYIKGNLPSKCKLWIVDYRARPSCDWTFWQTTEKYRVHGIKGYVDFNQFNGTKKDLKRLLW